MGKGSFLTSDFWPSKEPVGNWYFPDKKREREGGESVAGVIRQRNMLGKGASSSLNPRILSTFAGDSRLIRSTRPRPLLLRSNPGPFLLLLLLGFFISLCFLLIPMHICRFYCYQVRVFCNLKKWILSPSHFVCSSFYFGPYQNVYFISENAIKTKQPSNLMV